MKKLNTRKQKFLTSLSPILIEDINDKFQKNLCFNFQFFDNSQIAGQNFKDWTQEQLCKLLDKIKEYCKSPINHWSQMHIGKGNNHVLEIYKQFPAKSDFFHPKNVPLDVDWARFRLEKDMRLIGFFVHQEINNEVLIYQNTFYVVFLDALHKFYKI